MAPSTHVCPGGCGRQVPRHQYACKPCWSRLPKQLRDDIGFHWQMRNYSAHRAAMAVAAEWYAAQQGGA